MLSQSRASCEVSGFPMDAAFYKERARHMRNLASEADPFIKRRLLILANNYDAMATPRAAETISPNSPGPSQAMEEIAERTLPPRTKSTGQSSD